MTPAAALTPQRARDLGRTLAHRLIPLPQDPGGLAEAASLALLSLLPTWLPPGEEGTAAALRQLVRHEHFAAYLLAPAAGVDPAREALQRHLDQTFAAPLQPLLLLVSEGCREALNGLAVSLPLRVAAPVPARTAAPPMAAAAAAAPPSRPGDAGSLPGLLLAAGLCFAMGWLGYQLTQGLGRPTTDPRLQEALTATPRAGSARGFNPPQAPAGPAGKQAVAVAGGGSPARTGAALVSLQCLAGGQSEIAVPADPSNYGPRLAQDWQGRPVPNTPALIVLHETVADEAAALNLFRRRHSDDGQQASYHVLIGRDGRRLRLVDDAQRAFGAGDSAFEGQAVQLKPG